VVIVNLSRFGNCSGEQCLVCGDALPAVALSPLVSRLPDNRGDRPAVFGAAGVGHMGAARIRQAHDRHCGSVRPVSIPSMMSADRAHGVVVDNKIDRHGVSRRTAIRLHRSLRDPMPTAGSGTAEQQSLASCFERQYSASQAELLSTMNSDPTVSRRPERAATRVWHATASTRLRCRHPQ